MKLFLFFSVFGISFFAKATQVFDPKNLLPHVDRFIAGNLLNQCRDKTVYQLNNCVAKCINGSCALANCQLQNGIVFEQTYGTNSCKPDIFNIFFKASNASNSGLNFLKVDRKQFLSGSSAIGAGITYFLPMWNWSGKCSALPNTGFFDFGNPSNIFVVDSVSAANYSTKNGLQIPALKVSGRMEIEITQLNPGCTNGKTVLPTEVWVGQGVFHTEQVLQVDIAGKMVFKIDKITKEFLQR